MLVMPDGPDPPRPEPETRARPGLDLAASAAPLQERAPPARPHVGERRLTGGFKLTLRGAIFCIDWALRRCYGVREFSADQDDLLRVAVRRAKHDFILPDGARIAAGDAILDLHIWNERIVGLGRSSSAIAWASRVGRRLDHSLSNLAIRVRADPSLHACKAVRAEIIFTAGGDAAAAKRIAGHFGLTLKESRTASLGETLVGFGLAWACNPQSLRGKPFRRVRNEFWMSRAALLDRYPASEGAGAGPRTANFGDTAANELRGTPAVAPAGLADKSVRAVSARRSSSKPQP